MQSLLVLRKSLHIEQVLLFLLHSPLMVTFTLFDTPAQRLELAVLLIQQAIALFYLLFAACI